MSNAYEVGRDASRLQTWDDIKSGRENAAGSLMKSPILITPFLDSVEDENVNS